MYAVFGANGFLGSYLVRSILERTDEDVFAFNHTAAYSFPDPRVTNIVFDAASDDLRIIPETLGGCEDLKIIYLIFIHNADEIKRDPRRAYRLNITCYGKLLECFKTIDIKKFFFLSSDVVYGESLNGKVYAETDETVPVNEYGEHKLAAEKLTLSANFNVLRMSYLFGPSIVPQKKHFYDVIRGELLAGRPFSLFDDYIRNTMSYAAAANCIVKLCGLPEVPEILNLCGDRPVSKYESGLKMAEKIGADEKLVIRDSARNADVFEARRAYEILCDNTLLRQVLHLRETLE